VNELELFAGAGGGILGSQMLGHRTVCAVEYDAYARSVLLARQADGTFSPFPVWDDVRTFDGLPWRGIVDVVSGGFPCQDISVAGKGAGIDGERSGLWREMARVVSEVRPRFVFVENSPALVTRGLGTVLGDLSALGYDSRWLVMGAADVGAPHQRDRLWLLATDTRQHRRGQRKNEQVAVERRNRAPDVGIDGSEESLADPIGIGWDEVPKWEPIQGSEPRASMVIQDRPKDMAYADSAKRERGRVCVRASEEYTDISCPGWWAFEPELGRVAHGVAHRTHRLKAIGNGQVPQCRAAAWIALGGPT
jgi:DNA (cytosine-5)-methyltransferase 1